MTMSIRTSLGLLVALLLMSAGSDQLLAQGSPGAGGAEQPPPGAQQTPQMPPGGMNAGAGKKDQFEQGNVKIKGSDEPGVGSGEALQSMLPYIALVVVVVVGIGIYFAKSSGAPAAQAPVAEAPLADPAPIADDAVAGADDGGFGGGGGDDGGGDGGE